jgi:hypothetical protein
VFLNQGLFIFRRVFWFISLLSSPVFIAFSSSHMDPLAIFALSGFCL